MKKRYFLSVVFTLASFCTICSQSRIYADINIKKLKKADYGNAGEVYIKAKISKKGNLHVFLVNASEKITEPFLFHSDEIEFVKEAKDENGKWHFIDQKDSRWFVCAMSMKYGLVEPSYYTWTTIPKKIFSGDFSTEVRFSYKIDDSTVISKPIFAHINKDLFLPEYRRTIKQIDEFLESNRLISDNHKIRLTTTKYGLLYRNGEIKKALIVAKSFETDYPESFKAKYLFARALVAYISKNKGTLDSSDKNIILSKAIDLWEQLAGKNKSWALRPENAIEKYSSLLISREEWSLLKNQEFTEKGDDIYAKLDILNDDLVKLRFKEN